MQAYKIAVDITEHHTVKLPDEIPAGPAEVIVLVGARKPAPVEEGTPQHEQLRRYVDGYSRAPETAEEIAAAEAAAAHLLAEEPWE